MAHPGLVYVPLTSASPPRPTVAVPWLGFAVFFAYMTLHTAITEYDLHHQDSQLPGPLLEVLWGVVMLACCLAPLLLLKVSWKRRLVAVGLFASMLAVAFLGRSIRLPADMYLSEWTSPLLYAAGWITVRHTSLRPYFALIVTPILTAVFLPGGPVIEAIGRSGGILPFDVFLAAVLLAGLLPVVATVVVAGAIAQEVPVALPGETELRRWPYWLAVIAFIAALAGAMVFTIPTGLPILAIVLGHAASSTVKRKGLGGRAFAITAYILGYLEVIAFLWTLYISIVNWKFVF